MTKKKECPKVAEIDWIREKELIGERQNQLIDYYERGIMNLDDLTHHLNTLRDYVESKEKIWVPGAPNFF